MKVWTEKVELEKEDSTHMPLDAIFSLKIISKSEWSAVTQFFMSHCSLCIK